MSTWTKVSLLIGLISGLLVLYLTHSPLVSTVVFVLIGFLVWFNDPKKRYMRIALLLFSSVIVLNRWVIQLTGELFGLNIDIKTPYISDAVSMVLILGGVVALVLDYLQRGGHLSGTFLDINKNIVNGVSGNNIHINQSIKKGEKDDQ